LLATLGLPFRVVSPRVPEPPNEDELPAAYAARVAKAKARWAVGHRELVPGERTRYLVIAADTIVTLGGRILGKPASREEARRMLGLLSGRSHVVITAMCVLACDRGEVERESGGTVCTEVDVKPLSGAEIEAYLATGEPMDKAGAYAIQDKAAYMIRSLRGSYTNVVGLPAAVTAALLEQAGALEQWP